MKRFKNLCCILLSVCVLLTSFQLIASAEGQPSIDVSNSRSVSGGNVEVTIDLANNPGIVSMTLNINYDDEALTLKEVKDAGVLGTQVHKPEFVNPYTLAWVNDTATTNYTGNGTIVTLAFSVSSEAESGTVYPIKVTCDFDNYESYDKDLNIVRFALSNGSITVDNTVSTESASSKDTSPMESDPSESTVPTDYSGPSNATDVTESVYSTEDTIPTDPSESTIPSESINPTSTEPSETTIPTDTVPSESTVPTENKLDPTGTQEPTQKPVVKPATSAGPGEAEKAVEKYITKIKGDNDPKGSEYGVLQAKCKKASKYYITIKWNKVKDASKYVIYARICGKKYNKITTVKNTSYKQKYLNPGEYYKFLIVAVNSKGEVITTSKSLHIATTGGKVGNHKTVTTAAKNNRVTLKVKKTFNLKAKAIVKNKKLKVKKHCGIRYETSNKKIATVTKKGVIKAKKKGSCFVYAYAQNGVCKKIKVTVK